LVPFRIITGGYLWQHQPSRGVQNDAIVGEPPVHVDGATRALKRILVSGQSDARGRNSLSFARTRFSDHQVPWKNVNALSRRVEFVDPFLKLAAKVIKLGAGISIAYLVRRGTELRSKTFAENFSLRCLSQ